MLSRHEEHDASKKYRCDHIDQASVPDFNSDLTDWPSIFDLDDLAPLSPSGSDGKEPLYDALQDLCGAPAWDESDALWLDTLLAGVTASVEFVSCGTAAAAPALASTDSPALIGGSCSLDEALPPATPPLDECSSAASSSTSASVSTTPTTHSTATRDGSCEVCERRFSKSGDLKRHMLIHTQVRAFPCDVCGRAFTLKGDLKRHVLAVHEHDRPFTCEHCPLSFPLRAQLRRHAVTHTHERPYECDICHKRFTQSGDVARHKRTHADERRFACERCGLAFRQRAHLTSHQRSRNCSAASAAARCASMMSVPSI